MLTLRSARKEFETAAGRVTALADIDLSVAAGEFVTIIGSNGAGKSTLLNAMAGTISLDRGQVLQAGRDVTALPEHVRARRVARVRQDPKDNTSGSMTVEENMALAWRRGRRLDLGLGVTSRLRRLFRDALRVVEMGLEDRLWVPVQNLSGGQRQALSLVMAVLSRPELLLLDEHTAALDPKAAQTILVLTDALVQERQLTTLMVTHNMEHALHYGRRLIMMHQGRLVLDISADEKRRLSVTDLVRQFEAVAGKALSDDRILLQEA